MAEGRTLYSNAVFLNLFRFVTPLLFYILHTRNLSYSFFNTYNIITIMITTKCCSRKIQQTTTTFFPQKCISWHLISNGNWFFTNIFNATVDFSTVWPTSKFVVECLTVLSFYHARLSFDFVPPFWCELELKNHSRRDILWQRKQYSESQFRLLWIYDSRTVHQNRENGISWKISRAYELFRRSQSWTCTSLRILAKAREVENGFRKMHLLPLKAQRNITGIQLQEIEGGLF